jgi:hypothetical protein
LVQYPGSLTAAQMILYLAGSDWTAASQISDVLGESQHHVRATLEHEVKMGRVTKRAGPGGVSEYKVLPTTRDSVRQTVSSTIDFTGKVRQRRKT